ncbi:GNAT family N-acetyltransferase [Paenibacillus soyae]|uniref:GNAT family N-acetyltransferase n=1 Tax=Paenibacillus soyae TaxID=2969249 RepID=A0A9X2MV36_9BACL|nr:GNAT family protein [Paenibacillus soyae]MCR2807105.1 GNAT family N-acetyltransferase [Paenibacillus soyae]
MNMEALFAEFPRLESGGLILKRIEERHLDELFDIYSNDRVFDYCGIIPKHNKTTVKSMIGHFDRDYNKRTRVKWGIFASDEPESLLGIMEAFDWNQKVNMVTVGYFLAESSWGRGVATNALGLLVRFLFEEANVNRIQAEVMPGNESSKRVLLKNGFVREGLLRQASFWSGKGVVDLEVYGLLRGEFEG